MSLQARDYQAYAVDAIWNYFRLNKGDPVVAMPTGTGKSVVIALFIKSALQAFSNQKILVVTHVKELIDQNYKKFCKLWPEAPAGVYSASLKRKEFLNNVIFAGIGSIYKSAHLFGRVDLLLIDEAHLVNPKDATMYAALIAQLRLTNPMLKVIGLTATPWRAGQGSIVSEGGLFTDICVDMTGVQPFNWLIDQGYIIPLVSPRTGYILDISGVGKRAGDYNETELQIAVTKAGVTRKAISAAMDLGAMDRKSWLIFATGIDHAKQIAQLLTEEFNIPCEAVYTGMEKRDQVIEDFKSGKLRAIVNNNILTTGFDHPALDLIIILRPTMSSVLWVQMLGRGTRPYFLNEEDFDLNSQQGRLDCIAQSGKLNCLVLDFAANGKRLGPINDPVIPRKKGEKSGPAPIKECEACGCENHSSARFCGGKPAPNQQAGYCGAPFSFAVKISDLASTTDLIAKEKEKQMVVIEELKVESIQYEVIARIGRNRMLQVSYQCGLSLIKEYVCLEHPKNNYAFTKANQWWKRRHNSETPTDVYVAKKIIDDEGIAEPKFIRVNTSNRFPEILAACFDGSQFGKNRVPSAEYDDTMDFTGVQSLNNMDIPF